MTSFGDPFALFNTSCRTKRWKFQTLDNVMLECNVGVAYPLAFTKHQGSEILMCERVISKILCVCWKTIRKSTVSAVMFDHFFELQKSSIMIGFYRTALAQISHLSSWIGYGKPSCSTGPTKDMESRTEHWAILWKCMNVELKLFYSYAGYTCASDLSDNTERRRQIRVGLGLARFAPSIFSS